MTTKDHRRNMRNPHGQKPRGKYVAGKGPRSVMHLPLQVPLNVVTYQPPSGTCAKDGAGAESRSMFGLWRITSPAAYDEAFRQSIKASMSRVALIGQPAWPAAAAQDAAAAIGVAIRVGCGDRGHQNFDIAMTAVAMCAAEGNAAACLLMSNVIRRLPEAGRAEARLATSWLVKAFRKTVDAAPFEEASS